MEREEAQSAAKDFAVKTTFENIRDPESLQERVVIFRNGEPALTYTIDFSIAYEVVKKLMLEFLYLKTLESLDVFESYASFEEYAEAETINRAKRIAELATTFEKCLRNERWMEWFEGIAAQATQSMLTNLAEKILHDYLLLENEAVRYTLDHCFYPPEIAKELDRAIAKLIKGFESKQTSKRAGLKQGGDRRSKHEWRNTEILEQYKQKVDELRPLWEFITKFHAENFNDDCWMSMLKESSRFKFLSQNCSEVPIKLLKRVADEGFSKREREPLTITLEHARHELNLPERKTETLRRYYTGAGNKGNKR